MRPMVTESGTVVQRKRKRLYLDLNLRLHERGANTLPLCYAAICESNAESGFVLWVLSLICLCIFYLYKARNIQDVP